MSRLRPIGFLILCVNILFLASFLYVLIPRVPVLCFHRILETPGAAAFDISRTQFMTLLNYLQERGYPQNSESGPAGLFQSDLILSFDDGSPEHLSFVMPELEKRGWSGLFFWVSNRLSSLRPEEKNRLRNSKEKHVFGSHTRSHRSLKSLAGQAGGAKIMETEVQGSKQDLEDLWLTRVENFAFPGGEFEATSLALTARCYKRSFSTEYEYYYPWFEGVLHGRMLIFPHTTIKDVQAYIDAATPWKSIAFLIQLFLTLFINLLFKVKNSEVRRQKSEWR